ncbi:MAG: hypothetical protein JJU05_07685 [Verrucomicrobia bacterium]|nr:hypothetical protein [Verrucomicrobiota bacterium]MCH8528746.1 hypothetical protein [Kiritimatiellia bacterium]
MSESPVFREAWIRHAAVLSRLVRAGWWWAWFVKGLLPGSALCGLALLTVRILDGSAYNIWLLYGLFLTIWAWVAIRKSSAQRLSEPQALSRLDVSLGFHHRLVSAYDGVAAWPEVPVRVIPPLRWNLPATLPPAALAACLLLFAAALPLPAAREELRIEREEPVAWTETAAFVEALKRGELVQPEALESLEKQLETLREKPREEWYRQGTLETTEQMRQQVERDARTLQRALEETSALLGLAMSRQEQLTADMREQMTSMLQDLLNDLGENGLPLSEDLLSRLQTLDLDQLPQMTPEQQQQLQNMLDQACESMGQCMIAGGMPGTLDADTLAELLALMEILGAGGNPGETPGASPLTFTDQHPELAANNPFALNNPDMSRAALGDLLQVTEGEHEVETGTAGGPAGALGSEGRAGETVWRDSLLPDEEKRLQQYFQ